MLKHSSPVKMDEFGVIILCLSIIRCLHLPQAIQCFGHPLLSRNVHARGNLSTGSSLSKRHFSWGEEKRKVLTKYFWPAALCMYRLQRPAAAESCQKQSSRGRRQRKCVIGNVHCPQTAFLCLATLVAGVTLGNEPSGWYPMNMGLTCPANPRTADPTSCVLHSLCEKNRSACAKAGMSMCTNTWACTQILQTPASPTRPWGLSTAPVQGRGMLTVSKGLRGRVGSSHPLRNAWETHSYPHFCVAEPQHRAESLQTHLWEILSPLTPKAFTGL